MIAEMDNPSHAVITSLCPGVVCSWRQRGWASSPLSHPPLLSYQKHRCSISQLQPGRLAAEELKLRSSSISDR